MKFIFTGTGTSTGIPMLACSCPVCLSPDPLDKRLRTSGVLQSDKTTLVFDTGPDFRTQMLRFNIRWIDAILFTHQHKDHTAGLDDVRPYNYLQNRNMPLYVSEAVEEHLRKEYYYVFERPDYPGLPKFEFRRVEGAKEFNIGDLKITPIPLMHGKLPILGYRCGKFAYLTDTNFIPDESKKLLEGVEILVIDALRKAEHYSHFHLDAALKAIEELKPKEAYLIHISHLMGRHADVSKELPDGVYLSYDGLIINWGE
ncbi:MAG: MBL fold metallo-hydrolase [Bacteroidia bacterium]|nr:MBL fold metallo-hydrolase [Bacteroidia bacterium]